MRVSINGQQLNAEIRRQKPNGRWYDVIVSSAYTEQVKIGEIGLCDDDSFIAKLKGKNGDTDYLGSVATLPDAAALITRAAQYIETI